MFKFWQKKPKKSTMERILERSQRRGGEVYVEELKGDGLTPETAFTEKVLLSGTQNDYARYIEPMHGKEGIDWTVQESIPIHTGYRHVFISLETIRFTNGETKQYYFNRSANIKITYRDELGLINK